ncbi:Maf family nucleotide pyrophosphatase [Soonwooa sp.]|uniref:Maf family protein n=1 Tax=Soonwooa sp. TaxID=1938592 RepID=UPI002613D85A|nr:Maf family nucleotide pyrophosphatase [Soonwooa sp.]
MKLLLASASPRRQELLASLNFPFEVVKIDCDESYPKDLETKNIAAFVAKTKAEAYHDLKEDEILLTSDTIVALENEILLKPKNAEEALEMLKKLSGKTHQVYTSICIKTIDNLIIETDCADVTMSEISTEEADYYINNYKPFDKAGSYGIQEWLGMSKIESIKGSYYSIMGLPTHLVYKHLSNYFPVKGFVI